MSLRKIANELGVAISTVHKHIHKDSLDQLMIKQQLKPAKHIDVNSVKDELNRLLHLAKIGQLDDKETIKNVLIMVKHYEDVLKIKLRGYNYKSICEKIKGNRPIYRKERGDKGSIRNQVVAENFAKILELVSFYYFKDAEGKLNTAIDLALAYAKRNENYYELTTLKNYKSTLRRQLSLHFRESGYQTIHDYLNHYNRFKNSLPRVTGAFTDDIKFMSRIYGDDHKADVASVWVYDDIKKEVVQRQVMIWSWDEPVTMKTWVYCKAGALNVDDLIQSVIPVILEVGLPREGFVTDNGIAKSEKWKRFISRLYEATGLATNGYRFSPAYEPTSKATTELKHMIWKREFDAYQRNYVAPNKEQGRHTGNALSPEEADMFFEDYKRKFEAYITGFYLERERSRNIGGKKVRISIKDYFDKFWQDYEPIYPTPQQIRWALSETKIVTYNNSITINKEQYTDRSDSCPVSFNGQRFIVLYNPYDLQEVDLYALRSFTDRITGVYYQEGSYITTLYNTRINTDKIGTVKRLQKDIRKNIKQLSVSVTALQELENGMPDEVSGNGEVIERRKTYRKQAEITIKQKIINLPKTQQPLQESEVSNEPEAEYNLTITEEET
ncbi:MAG: hypothetical protein AMXMBFR51_20820 [Ignavibacteriota bacterium]